ncbi:MAG: alpha amylase C-terminal domain-containing protein, partial [Rhizobiales bacterium]|nr:alpha amylase C-terminal domain-containing protein [Hyphomicrobiales bacterium]
LLDQSTHAGVQAVVSDLNRIYSETPALHEHECEATGFEWLVTDDAGRNIFAWLRKASDARQQCLVVVNFSPNVYRDYRIRVPFPGRWREIFNSDSAFYGGSNVGNTGVVSTSEALVPELTLSIPPLAAIYLTPEGLACD